MFLLGSLLCHAVEVTRDVHPMSVVVRVPAKVIKKIQFRISEMGKCVKCSIC